MREIIIPLATVTTTGACTIDATRGILGKLYAIEYRPNDIDTNVHLTITCRSVGGASKPLLFKEHPGTSNLWFYPRDLVQGVEDGKTDLTGTSGGDCSLPIIQGVPRVVLANGGNTVRTGTVIIYWEAL